MRTTRAPTRPSAPLMLALVLSALFEAGCAPAWPLKGPVSSADALIKSVGERGEALERLYSPDSRMRYGWKPARADIYLGEEDLFRLDIKHPFGTDKLYTLVVNDGRFVYVDHRKKKGGEGDLAEMIAARLPKLDLGPDVLTAWQLFLPRLDERSGESIALARLARAYVLEFWEPGHMPSRQVWVDASSHVPVRELFYTRDGRLAVEFHWRRLTWHEKEKLVLPHQVEISLPVKKIRIKLVLVKPQLDKEFRAAAFSLARERRLLIKSGGKIKQVRPEAPVGAPADGEKDASGAEAGRAATE